MPFEKSSFADVYKDVMAKLALLDVIYADLDQLMMSKHFQSAMIWLNLCWRSPYLAFNPPI